jgi:hypothetical protein
VIEKSRRLLGFALNGQGVHPREGLLSEESGHWGCVECVAVRKGCKRLDMSTQGEYTKSKAAFENVKDFNVSERQTQILPLRPAFLAAGSLTGNDMGDETPLTSAFAASGAA